MLIAHRGHSSLFPDNTLTGFKSAIKLNFDMIELDVNICKSGELIIYHDTLLHGKNINTYTLSELSDYDIISLKEYFNIKNINKMNTYIDVKGNEIVIKEVVNFFKENKEINLHKIHIASFNFYHLDYLFNTTLPVKRGLITCNKFRINEINNWIDKCDFFVFNWECYDNLIYKYLKQQKKDIFLYTCHNLIEYKYINENLNNDGIISNIYVKKI